jgi:signal transduction histidine kinase
LTFFMKLPSTLRLRLVLSHLLVCLVSLALILAFSGKAFFDAARDDARHSLIDLAFAASNTLERPLQDLNEGSGDIARVENSISRLLRNHPNTQYSLFWADGAPIVQSGGTLPARADAQTSPEVLAALQNEVGEADATRLDEQGEEAVFVAVRVQREDTVYGVVRLEVPLRPAMDSARRSLMLLLGVALIVILVVSIFAWAMASGLVRPIRQLTQTAERIARGEMGARVDPAGPQELHRLATAFNMMSVRMQDHVTELRAFVANASHELRTPLTVVKLRVEALRHGALNEPEVSEQFLSEVENEVDRLSRMVNDLLDISRMDAGLASTKRSPLNLAMMATEVFETFSIRASKAGLCFEVHIEPDLPAVMGNEDQLRRVLYNFVDNAIKYTPSGGQVDLHLASGRNRKIVRILVKDTGPGISAEHLKHIFERFYRVEATRPRYGISRGSGLGLAIAKTIVENHGGTIGVSSQLGQGATFWVELPVHV